MISLPRFTCRDSNVGEREVRGPADAKKLIRLRHLIFFKFKVDEYLNHGAGGRLRKVHDAPPCGVPAGRVFQTTLPGQRLFVAYPPKIHGYANMPPSI